MNQQDKEADGALSPQRGTTPEQRSASEAKDEAQPQGDDETRPREIISLDAGAEGEPTPELDEETTADLLKDALEEEYEKEVARHTADEEIQEDFEDRQDLADGREKLHDRLQKYHAKSPQLSGGDVDAAWDEANVGDETVGGTTLTPDQDVVDELGEAVGLTYEDDEPLRTGERMEKRDQNRWELDPESAEDDEDT
jgi:hypothetical protein